MARWNDSIVITFNDNDGSMWWSANPESAEDLFRHQQIFGKYRTRWIFFKRFLTALFWLEEYAKKRVSDERKTKLWVFKAEIPE